MPPAALRFFALGAGLLLVACLRGAEPTARSAPSRPGGAAAPAATAPRLASKKYSGVDYVSVADIAKQLGLRLTWVERGRRLTLAGASGRTEIEADTRDIVVNGMRVFLGNPVVDEARQLFVSRIDYERCLAPMLRPGFGTAAPAAPRTIVLDPGHGGRDTGTSLHEKTYALDVARRAKKLLEVDGFKVVLTREDDVFIELQQRPAIANANRADAFVSIHFNALERDTKTSGVEVYTFPPQSQRSANSWAPGRRDDAEPVASPVNRHDHWSAALAHTLHRRFVGDLKAFDRGKKLMHLGALRGLNCPGVLLECGFLTSEAEARKIATPAYRQQLAEAVAAGVRDYATAVTVARSRANAASRK